MELEALKKELRNTQRQLAKREAELQNQIKRKGKPTPKTPKYCVGDTFSEDFDEFPMQQH